MSELNITSPYRGVHPFRYADRDLFFGREQEVEELIVNVILYRLVVVFGESGAGKSSVINAGLAPALEKRGFRSERIRVSPQPNIPFLVERVLTGDSRVGVFLPSIFVGYQSQAAKIDERVPLEIDHFLGAIHESPEGVTPLLIFDQFEELFTLFSVKQEGERLAQAQIFNTLVEIANNPQLKVKILVIIREDFLGKLELLSKKYPQILDHYIRLGHLDREGATRAIVGPFEKTDSFPSRITYDLATVILEQLSQGEAHGAVKATQLQIVCDQLWKRYASDEPEIGVDEFNAINGVHGILDGYFKSELEQLGPSRKLQAIRVLAKLITSSDTRDIVSEDKLKGLLDVRYPRDADSLSQTLKLLEDQRIIIRTTQRDTYYYEVASEYLITPIKREKQRDEEAIQRALIDQRWKRQRAKGIAVFAVVVVATLPAYWGYAKWLELQPWGYLHNLSTGFVHALEGDFAAVGRGMNQYFKQIALQPNEISRMHLFISRKLVAIDVRSLNGTTINAEFLPYGKVSILNNGDIIALAGIAPFRFSTSERQARPPVSAWAMVIDGKARAYYYLSSDHYVLALNRDGTIAVSQRNGAIGLLSIERTNEGMTIEDTEDGHELRVEMRLGDYTYVSCKMPPGKPFYYLKVTELDQYQSCDVLAGRSDLKDVTRLKHDLSTVTYKYGDTPFQLVPIVPDLEAPPAS